MRVLLLFVDGVGVGPDDPATNPLVTADLPALAAMLGGRRPLAGVEPGPPLAPLDARLGVPGLPQSATGQTALLTGLNAPALIGRHLGPYPGAELRPLLAGHSLWADLAASGRRAALANAYPDRYLERARRGTGRMGAFARGAVLAGIRLRGPGDLRAGRAVSAFLTNQGWREHLGYRGLPDVTEEQAGARVAALAREHDLTVFEYYATDIAGHRGDRAAAHAALEAFDRFVAGVVDAWSPNDVLIVASDHGNVEDCTTRRHTLWPALGVWVGPGPSRPLTRLTDVAPAIRAALGLAAGEPWTRVSL